MVRTEIVTLLLTAVVVEFLMILLLSLGNYTNIEDKENLCKKFCSVIGQKYGKTLYSPNYRDYICLCERVDYVIINNTTYSLIRYLDYGVVKNVGSE